MFCRRLRSISDEMLQEGALTLLLLLSAAWSLQGMQIPAPHRQLNKTAWKQILIAFMYENA